MNWWIIVLCFAGFTYQEENFAIVTQYITVPLAFAYQWFRAKKLLKLLPTSVSVREFKIFRIKRKYMKWASVNSQINLLKMTKQIENHNHEANRTSFVGPVA